AAARAPADVALARIAFGQRFFFGRPAVDQRQRDVGLALFDVDPAGKRTDRAPAAAEMAEQPADRGSSATAAAILVGADDVGLQEVIRGLNLALAVARAALQLTLVGER